MSAEDLKRLQAKAFYLAQELEIAKRHRNELAAILKRHLHWYDEGGLHREEENRLLRQTREALQNE